MPTSDDLEAFHARLRELKARLGKLKSAEVTRPDLIQDLAAAAKDWLRDSQGLRTVDTIEPEALEQADECMRQVLNSTATRGRASAYRSKLEPVIAIFVDAIILPLIRHEGNPHQVAARQLQALFDGLCTPDEQAYVDEAAKCMTVSCHRASIIMLWAAAIARIHATVANVGFAAFNAALTKTVARKAAPYSYVKAGPISSLPELQRMRDYDLIVVGMELWSYDLPVFGELDRLLSTRNGVAHPGMLHPTALDVQQFAAKTASLVFSKIRP